MQLFDALWQIGAEDGHFRFLVKPGCDHDIAGARHGPAVRPDKIALAPGILFDRADADAVTHRQLESLNIVLKVTHDFLPGHEAIGIVPPIFGAGHPRLPIRSVEHK